jgi:hypothetical protein
MSNYTKQFVIFYGLVFSVIFFFFAIFTSIKDNAGYDDFNTSLILSGQKGLTKNEYKELMDGLK